MENIDYFRFAVPDIFGRSKGSIIPKRHLQDCINAGVPIYGGTLYLGFRDELLMVPAANITHEQVPRATLIPDMNTLHDVPWCGGDKFKLAEVICDSYWLSDGTPQLVCPRYIARKQLDRLADLNFALLSGFEMEFLLTEIGESSGPDVLLCHRKLAKQSGILFEIESQMYKAGIDIENMHMEGGPGLFEMVLKPQAGLTAVDTAFMFKNGIQELADRNAYNVHFKSRIENNDIGMHFNHSLWSVSNNVNVFADTIDNLSETGRHWLAGLIKHAKALTALYCPTDNCYKRLHRPSRPSVLFWHPSDCSACFKVKSGTTKKGIYVENRIPSGLSNPYLVLAATVAAGLDGVINKLECPHPGKTPKAEMLPSSLSDALQCLMADRYLVESLGVEFVECFVAAVEVKTV